MLQEIVEDARILDETIKAPGHSGALVGKGDLGRLLRTQATILQRRRADLSFGRGDHRNLDAAFHIGSCSASRDGRQMPLSLAGEQVTSTERGIPRR